MPVAWSIAVDLLADDFAGLLSEAEVYQCSPPALKRWNSAMRTDNLATSMLVDRIRWTRGAWRASRPKTTEGEAMAERVDGVVVTFDPVRHTGFLRIVGPGPSQRVFFRVQSLPDEFRQGIAAAVKRVRVAVRYESDDGSDDFKDASKALRALVVGQRFSFELKRREDGKNAIVTGTTEHIADVDAPPTARGAWSR